MGDRLGKLGVDGIFRWSFRRWLFSLIIVAAWMGTFPPWPLSRLIPYRVSLVPAEKITWPKITFFVDFDQNLGY